MLPARSCLLFLPFSHFFHHPMLCLLLSHHSLFIVSQEHHREGLLHPHTPNMSLLRVISSLSIYYPTLFSWTIYAVPFYIQRGKLLSYYISCCIMKLLIGPLQFSYEILSARSIYQLISTFFFLFRLHRCFSSLSLSSPQHFLRQYKIHHSYSLLSLMCPFFLPRRRCRIARACHTLSTVVCGAGLTCRATMSWSPSSVASTRSQPSRKKCASTRTTTRESRVQVREKGLTGPCKVRLG